MKFVGFVSQHHLPSKYCNGASHDGVAESGLHVRHSSQDNCKSCNEGAFSGHWSESGVEEEAQRESGQHPAEGNSSPGCSKPEWGEGESMHVFLCAPNYMFILKKHKTKVRSAGYEDNELI